LHGRCPWQRPTTCRPVTVRVPGARYSQLTTQPCPCLTLYSLPSSCHARLYKVYRITVSSLFIARGVACAYRQLIKLARCSPSDRHIHHRQGRLSALQMFAVRTLSHLLRVRGVPRTNCPNRLLDLFLSSSTLYYVRIVSLHILSERPSYRSEDSPEHG